MDKKAVLDKLIDKKEKLEEKIEEIDIMIEALQDGTQAKLTEE